jgi:hypothetical protein
MAVIPISVLKRIGEKTGRNMMEFFKSRLLSAGCRLAERQT